MADDPNPNPPNVPPLPNPNPPFGINIPIPDFGNDDEEDNDADGPDDYDNCGVPSDEVPFPTEDGGFQVECGAAVPLTNVMASLTSNPKGGIFIQGGNSNLYIFAKDTNGTYRHVSTKSIPPFCSEADGTTPMVASPISQFIAFGQHTNRILIRLQPGEEYDSLKEFVVLKRSGNSVIIPPASPGKDCVTKASLISENRAEYSDITLVPKLLKNCNITHIYPEGERCSQRIQHLNTDDPQLVVAPGQMAMFRAIPDASTHLAVGTAGSIVMLNNESEILMGWGNGQLGGPITLVDGGTVFLPEGKFINVPADSVIKVSPSGRATFSKGGIAFNAEGTQQQEVPAGSGFIYPREELVRIMPTGAVIWPPSLEIPVRDGGLLRLPQ